MKPKKIEIPQALVQSRRPIFNRGVGKSFDVRAQQDVTQIDLYDEIGFFGVSAQDLRAQLRNADDVLLRIHSPGGDVFDGITMFNDLIDHPHNVDVEIAGLAASSASLIAMAGNNITIASTGMLMIHNVWSLVIGDRNDMRDVANIMEPLDRGLADIYTFRTGASEVSDWMDAETWWRGQDAVDAGFADKVKELESPNAKFDLSGFKNAPRQSPWALQGKADKSAEPKTKRDMEQRLMHDAGLSRSEARALMRGGFDGMQDAAADEADVTPGANDDLVDFVRNLQLT